MSQLKFKTKVLKISEKGANIILQNCRVAFVHLAEPAVSKLAGFDPKYEVTCLIPKSATAEIEKIKQAIKDTVRLSEKLKTASDKKKAESKALKIHQEYCIIRDGDKTKNADGIIYDGLEDHFLIKAKTGVTEMSDGSYKLKVPLALKYRSNVDIETENLADELYSGMWADVAVTFQGYIFMKKPGVTVYLNGVMKLKNDERLGKANPFEARDDIVEEEILTTDENAEY